LAEEEESKRINFRQLPAGDCVCFVDCPSASMTSDVEQRSFVFDSVFGDSASTREIFES
jgi:hypothetical protein